MKFVLRDDDLNVFSTQSDIERWYSDIFAADIPVGLSAIPFVTAQSDVYLGESPPNGERAIHENKELCAYVPQQPLIEILQHGTTHETHNGIFEYAANVPRESTLRGRAELERAFGQKVDIFVPPHDWIGTSGIYSVEQAGMNIIRGRGAGLRNFIIRPAYILNFVRMAVFKFLHALRGNVPAYPYVLDFGKHKELCSYRLEDTDVFDGLEYTHQKNGIFVVVTHLHFYTPEKKERLLALIKRARELGAAFVPPSAIFTA